MKPPSLRRAPIVLSLLLPALAVVAAPSGEADVVVRSPGRSFTTVSAAYGIARQPSTGRLFVSHDDGFVRAYEPGATGPQAGEFIANGLSLPGSGAFDSQGRYYVPERSGNDVELVTFSPPSQVSLGVVGLSGPRAVAIDDDDTVFITSSHNDSLFIRESTGSVRVVVGDLTLLDNPTGVAVASDGSVVVATSDGLRVFPPGASGNMAPIRTLAFTDSFTAFREVHGLAVDDADNMYVVNVDGTVGVWSWGASGTAAPNRVLDVDNAFTSGPIISLLVNPQRQVVLPELGDGRVSTFAPLVPFAAPGRVRSLAVAGKATAKQRLVTWLAPASAGDRPVTSYLVKVRKGTKVLRTATVRVRRLVLFRSALRAGRLTVSVRARSAIGTGPVVSKAFVVRLPRAS